MFSLIAGKDPLWGNKYYKESDTSAQAVVKGIQKTAEYFMPTFSGGRYSQRAIKILTGYKAPKNAYGEKLGWEEYWKRIAGIRKFNRQKELLKHFKATVKAYRYGNISKDEMIKEQQKIYSFAKRHNIPFDYKKAAKYQKRYGKRVEDYSLKRWFL